jgi:glyoxylase-like metal-dependent hydrolase (beta-lactamase superfamily II)
MIKDSKHFTVEMIKDGVWAAISLEGGSHITNSGIIDLGKETLIFDTGLCIESATELKEVAIELTGNTPTLITNSHFHNDHFWGNHVFTEAKIIASNENVRVTEPKWKQDAEHGTQLAKKNLGYYRNMLESESEYEREYAKIMVGFLSGIAETGPVFEYRSPDITYDGKWSYSDGKRRVELIEYRNGHSESDCVLYLPDVGVLFTGDLCMVGYHLVLDLGDPLNSLKILDQMKHLRPEIVVPGHGFVGDISIVDDVSGYIRTLSGLVEELISKGGSIEDAEAIPVPVQYQDYQMRDFSYKRNLRKLYQVLTE